MKILERTALLRGLFVVSVLLAWPEVAQADVEMPAVFGSGMVLQRDRPVPVWGWATPGEVVHVEFAGQKHKTSADAKGGWLVTLDPLSVRRKGSTLTIRGSNRIRLKDVLVGEVWIASGQSNMEWPVGRANEPLRGWKEPNPSRIRLLRLPHKAMSVPQADVVATWRPASDASARKQFSAVAWFFGCEICARTRMPVGLIDTSWGGTAVLPWTPGAEAPPPVRSGGKAVGPRVAGALYNGMVAPLVPFAMRGAIWYQGESDAARAKDYGLWFPDLIRAWRKAWGQGDFPFYFVQLANFRKRAEQPEESAWAELREAQRQTLAGVANTGMAVTIDIGQANDIHPRNKHDVGLRLSRWARARDYGEKIVPSGPLYASHEFGDGKVVLHFTHATEMLKVKGRGRLKGFALAGADKQFVWADAVIEGGTVVVSHPAVPEPVAVRYGWANNPECNLVNVEGLPASPFRTDQWPRLPRAR